MARIAIVLLAGLITFANTRSTNAAEPPTSDESAATGATDLITVRVEQAGLSESAAAKIVDLASAAEQRLSVRYGSAPSQAEAGRRTLVVHVSPGPFAGDYLVRVEAHFDGALVGDVAPEPCLSCSVVQIVDGVEEAAGELVGQFPAPVTEPEPEPTDAVSDEPTASDEPAARDSSTRPLLVTGISATVVGGLGLATGIGLIVAHEQAEPNEGQPFIRVVDYRPAGIGVAAVSGAVLIAGVVLIVVRVREGRERRTALVPALGPGFAGGVLVGRF